MGLSVSSMFIKMYDEDIDNDLSYRSTALPGSEIIRRDDSIYELNLLRSECIRGCICHFQWLVSAVENICAWGFQARAALHDSLLLITPRPNRVESLFSIFKIARPPQEKQTLWKKLIWNSYRARSFDSHKYKYLNWKAAYLVEGKTFSFHFIFGSFRGQNSRL
jgi:hypothetical protein